MEYNKSWSKFSHQISEACSRFDDLYVQRTRRLGAFEVVHGVLKLKAADHESYRSIFCEVSEPFAASSFCNARKKFPAEIFAQIRSELLEVYESFSVENPDWKGFRVFAIDGSTLNLPANLKREKFHVARSNHYPQGLLSILFNVINRKICGLDFTNSRCERRAASRLTADLGQGDIVIGDKGYLSFGLLCELSERNVTSLFNVQKGGMFREVLLFRDSNRTEEIVKIDPSKDVYRRASRQHPDVKIEPQKLRLIKYVVGDSVEILATTIFDDKIRASEIAELYWLRWRIEELYKAFKNALNVESFHSKSANGVEQELHAASILWNFSRFLESYIPKSAFKKTHKLLKNITLPNKFHSIASGS